jgi:hypothetical protein
MPRSFPDSTILLKAAIKYLEEELMPTLDPYHRFKTRVTANVLSTIKRELELRDTQAVAEHARLIKLLGHDGDLEALSVELAESIRTDAMPLDKPGLRDHLKQSLHDALSISNPKWLTR